MNFPLRIKKIFGIFERVRVFAIKVIPLVMVFEVVKVVCQPFLYGGSLLSRICPCSCR